MRLRLRVINRRPARRRDLTPARRKCEMTLGFANVGGVSGDPPLDARLASRCPTLPVVDLRGVPTRVPGEPLVDGVRSGHNGTSPFTGEIIELTFTGLGSTLRGARQQRKPSTGWANWNNDGSANDPTLDSQ